MAEERVFQVWRTFFTEVGIKNNWVKSEDFCPAGPPFTDESEKGQRLEEAQELFSSMRFQTREPACRDFKVRQIWPVEPIDWAG